MMHTSAASGVEAVAESQTRGFPIYGETLHQYLMFASDDYRRAGSAATVAGPRMPFHRAAP